MISGFSFEYIRDVVFSYTGSTRYKLTPFQYCKKNQTGNITHIAQVNKVFYFARVSGSGDQNPTLDGVSLGFSSGLCCFFDSYSTTGINLPVQIVGYKIEILD